MFRKMLKLLTFIPMIFISQAFGGEINTPASTGGGIVQNTECQILSPLHYERLPANSYFGFSIAVSANGKTALIGAASINKVYVFEYNDATKQWEEKQILENVNGAISISADGKTAMIGAAAYSHAYVFKYNDEKKSWEMEHDFSVQTDVNTVAISADGKTTLIGSSVASPGDCFAAGQVFVFKYENNTWKEKKILTASDKTEQASFGCAIAVSHDGNTVFIGSRLAKSGTGEAYVFRYNNKKNKWIEQILAPALKSDLKPTLKQPYDYFGRSISASLDGKTALIGSKLHVDGYVGQVHIFEYNNQNDNWIEKQILKIEPKDKNESQLYDNFGCSLAISADGKTGLIGADFYNCSSGLAYVFKYDYYNKQWKKDKVLGAFDRTKGRNFGFAVGISADAKTFLVSRPTADDDNNTIPHKSKVGQVYYYSNNKTTSQNSNSNKML